MAHPIIGNAAPDFTLKTAEEKELSLSDFKGKNVVLYFYPKDNTPGCTLQACSFRDNLARLQQQDTVVLGVSKDSAQSHQKFSTLFKLPFPLLSDPEAKVIEAYGAWQEKSMFGKKYMGIQRSTFLIDKEGILQHIWPKVKVKGHVDDVLKVIEALD